MESIKNIIVAVIIAAAVVASAFVVKTAKENAPKQSFTLYGYEGVVYRLNTINGRIDVLVPSNEAALLFPVGQIQLPAADAKLSKEQQKSFSQNIQALSQYIQIERARSLGQKVEFPKPAESK